ncbi:hypothetical protein BBO_09479 [Beauveria brongniartii RCEF 3172]|uniref:Uncharacterized protein n=1 Tax=Beauveria brongniartii RCEF 3172 TaxID=1081107 RepID=A0A168FDH3_9HYPO|nr:hypothetical protein BBO_09479 [Beauveria brongniartii RCEF 3172]
MDHLMKAPCEACAMYLLVQRATRNCPCSRSGSTTYNGNYKMYQIWHLTANLEHMQAVWMMSNTRHGAGKNKAEVKDQIKRIKLLILNMRRKLLPLFPDPRCPYLVAYDEERDEFRFWHKPARTITRGQN